MEMAEYLSILLSRWRVVVATAFAGLVVAGGLSQLVEPVYIARTKVFFAVDSGRDARELNRAAIYTRALVGSYAEVTAEPVVLDPVIRRLGLPMTTQELAARVTARAPQDTALVEISVSDSSPRRSAAIADALGSQLSDVVPTLAPRSDRSIVPVRATTVTPASVPTFKSAPRTKVNLVLGLLGGTVLGLGLAVARHRADVRISDAEAVRITGAPVLGWLRPPPRGLVARLAGAVGRAREPDDDLHQLRTAVQHLRLHNGYRTLLLTSPVDGAPSAATARALAETLVGAGSRVLLVDADLQVPVLTRQLAPAGAAGLTDVLSSGLPWQLAVAERGDPPVTLLGAGLTAPDPDLVIESRMTSSVLRRAARQFDVMVMSGPPVLRVADALLLSRVADGVVLVVDRRRTSRDELAEGFARLQVVGATVLGVVLRG